VARLRTLRRISVAGNLDQQGAHRRTELGLEEQIKDLAALGLGIILEKNRSRPTATHRPDPVEAFATRVSTEIDTLVGEERRRRHGEEYDECSQKHDKAAWGRG